MRCKTCGEGSCGYYFFFSPNLSSLSSTNSNLHVYLGSLTLWFNYDGVPTSSPRKMPLWGGGGKKKEKKKNASLALFLRVCCQMGTEPYLIFLFIPWSEFSSDNEAFTLFPNSKVLYPTPILISHILALPLSHFRVLVLGHTFVSCYSDLPISAKTFAQ